MNKVIIDVLCMKTKMDLWHLCPSVERLGLLFYDLNNYKAPLKFCGISGWGVMAIYSVLRLLFSTCSPVPTIHQDLTLSAFQLLHTKLIEQRKNKDRIQTCTYIHSNNVPMRIREIKEFMCQKSNQVQIGNQEFLQ